MAAGDLLEWLASGRGALARTLRGRRAAADRRAFARAFGQLVQAKPGWTEFGFLVPLLERRPLVAPDAGLDDAQVQRLLDGARTAQEAMVAASVVLRCCDRARRAVYEAAAATLERVPLAVSAQREPVPDGAADVTVLASVTDGSHLQATFALAAALLATPRCGRLYLVITREWNWMPPSGTGSRRRTAAQLRRAFLQQVSHFDAAEVIRRELDRRLRIVVSPTESELAESVGAWVVRFEGAAHFRSTYLCGAALHAARPVVTATYSSVVEHGRNTDLTLVRGAPGPGQRLFIQPSPLARGVAEPSPRQRQSRTFATIYAEDRIRQGLGRLAGRDWEALSTLFDRWPDARWLLVGVDRPEAARAQLPAAFRHRHEERLAFLGYSDLATVFAGTRGLLQLPGAFGGGVTAATGIAMGVPVLVMTDPRSDVANALPAGLHVQDFTHAVETLGRWFGDEAAWEEALARQQAVLRGRMDLAAKGAELIAILRTSRGARGPAP